MNYIKIFLRRTSRMFQLPPDVIKKIWEYDPTYKNVMNLCLLELQYVSPYWGLRVMWDKEYYIKTIEKSKYDKYYNINKNLASYWNNDYRKVIIERGRRLNPRETKYWTYNEFICDVYEGMHFRIFQNIKSYKYCMDKITRGRDTEHKSQYYKAQMSSKRLKLIAGKYIEVPF